jgi:hypothetical protein
MRRAALLALLAVWVAAPAASATPVPAAVMPDGVPKCDYVITIPPAESVTGSVDARGVLHLVVGAYVHVPVATAVLAAGKDVRLTMISSGKDETFCTVPLRVTGAPSRPFDVAVTVRRGAGRPTTTVRTSVR